MTDAILFTIITILSVIGIADLIRLLTEKILGGAKKQVLFSIIPCKGHEEELEYLVRNAYIRLSSHGSGSCCILLVDCGMDEETREICGLLCDRLDCVELCEENELDRVIKEKFHLQIA